MRPILLYSQRVGQNIYKLRTAVSEYTIRAHPIESRWIINPREVKSPGEDYQAVLREWEKMYPAGEHIDRGEYWGLKNRGNNPRTLAV